MPAERVASSAEAGSGTAPLGQRLPGRSATATERSATPAAAQVVGSGRHPGAPGRRARTEPPSIITPSHPSTANMPDTYQAAVTKVVWAGATE
jgi:hypothetical protein